MSFIVQSHSSFYKSYFCLVFVRKNHISDRTLTFELNHLNDIPNITDSNDEKTYSFKSISSIEGKKVEKKEENCNA